MDKGLQKKLKDGEWKCIAINKKGCFLFFSC